MLWVQQVSGLSPVALCLPWLQFDEVCRFCSPDKGLRRHPGSRLWAFTKLAALLGPAAGLLAEGEAQTMAFGNPHPAIAQF